MDQTPTKAEKLTVETYGLMALLRQASEEGFSCEHKLKIGCTKECVHFSACGELQDVLTILYGKGERPCT